MGKKYRGIMKKIEDCITVKYRKLRKNIAYLHSYKNIETYKKTLKIVKKIDSYEDRKLQKIIEN